VRVRALACSGRQSRRFKLRAPWCLTGGWKTVAVGKAMRPFVLTKGQEEILKAVHFYRYMTAQDVCFLLYSPSSLVYVRKLLSTMAGKGDGVANQYLYRFALPSVSAGNPRRVYTLGSLGREFLVDVTGLAADWYFRPHKVKHLSFSKVLHNLFLTRFLVAARRWAAADGAFELLSVRTCYELEGTGGTTQEEPETRARTGVIPDGWLLFAKRRDNSRFPVLLEIDRGTAYRQNFKQHVKGRLEYIKAGGEYTRVFGEKAVRIAYVTTGETEEYREARLRSMQSWTMEVLKELKKENWAQVFRFHSLSLDEIYELQIFEDAVWYRPDMQKPVGLFG
jgi:hypothetical protein